MSVIWLIVLTLGAIALIAVIYFSKARNAHSQRSYDRAEQGAKDLREDMRDDPE